MKSEIRIRYRLDSEEVQAVLQDWAKAQAAKEFTFPLPGTFTVVNASYGYIPGVMIDYEPPEYPDPPALESPGSAEAANG